ncbi:uncharacterized protein [Periplaneta americana]|uniref:uncharacterized protein isoform X2 n=1 Tax=Periplaneta americana TaxID=6978 RepID=UPI0037E860E8
MNHIETEVGIVESILPTIEDENSTCEENGIIIKNEPEAIIFQTLDENGFIHATQHGSLVMTPVSQLKGNDEKSYSVYADAVDAGKQYSSATIVGAGDVSQNEMEVTTIHVLGLDETGGNMEVAYDNALQVPVTMETLEVPVETVIAENDEIQSIQIGDYAAVVNPSGSSVHEHQPMVIASTDSQGNCYVAVQENQVVPPPSWNNKSNLPTVTRMVQPRNPTGSRGFVRFGRSRMIADQHTTIQVADFKAQLSDTSDIMGKLSLAPSTKKMMNFLSTKGFGKLFSSSGKKMNSPVHMRLFTRHLIMRPKPVEETFDDMVLLPLGYQPEVDPTKIKRITRRRRYPEAEEYQRKLIQQQMQQTFDNLVAESQKNMQTVFLENSGSLGEDHGNLQILVQAAENDSMEQEERSEQPDVQVAVTNQDCSIQEETQHTDETLPSNDWLGTVQQFIIIVPIDPLVDTITETVITS